MTPLSPAAANSSQMPPSPKNWPEQELSWLGSDCSLWPSRILATLREDYRQHLASMWYKSPNPSAHGEITLAKLMQLSCLGDQAEISHQLSPRLCWLLPQSYSASLIPLQVSPESSSSINHIHRNLSQILSLGNLA